MTPQLARLALALSLGLGLLADGLLRGGEWRAGFAVWTLAALAVAWIVTARVQDEADPSATRERRLLFGVAGALALSLVLRDAETLYAVDGFAFVVTLWLIAWRAHGRPLTALEPRDAIIGVASAAAAAVAGAPTLAVRDTAPGAIDDTDRRSLRGFGIGAVIAAPVLLLVTGLLASADPLFAGFLENVGAFLEARFFDHVLMILLATWLSAGALRGAVLPVGVGPTMFRREFRLPFAAFAPLLGGLALLLSAWIGLQVRTLFGGAEYVAETAGVTVAEYARQGFFELIVISGIVLAALLVADDVIDRGAEAARSNFRRLGTVLILLVAAILTSAVLRLSLYLRYFGLTEDRVLALAVLVWVALVLGLFAWTVLRNERARFAPGVLVVSAAWLTALNLANPERWVVETNLDRASRGLDFDVAYHARLSGDALGALLAGAERLAPAQAAELRAALTAEWNTRAANRDDWRRWTLPYLRGVQRMVPRP